MSIISLAEVVAAEGDRKAEESKADFERQLPRSTLDDVSPCCGASVNYSLGKGNPSCDKCGKPIYS